MRAAFFPMLNRRTFCGSALALPVSFKVKKKMPATIAMTFDTDVTTYTNALWDMAAKGIPGTFFADADRINGAGQPTRDNLLLMAMQGWEIGARVYGTLSGAEANMVSVMTNNRSVAFDRLKAAKDLMYAQGFAIKSIAASQRAWSMPLRGMAAQLFEGVRVADVTAWGGYPVDPLYVRAGGTSSWSGADTPASLRAQLDAVIAAGGVWYPVIHRVDNTGDPNYTIPVAVFADFTTYLKSKIAAGLVRAVTFQKSLAP